jgi:hypothetical protein
MPRFLFIAGFGFLPLWTAIAFVYVGGRQPGVSPDYWNVAPWFVLYAVPVCGVTVGMAVATIAVFRASSGGFVRQFLCAGGVFVSLVILVAAAGWAYWLHRERVQVGLEAEQSQVLEFVRSHKTVVSATGSDPKVSVSSKKLPMTGQSNTTSQSSALAPFLQSWKSNGLVLPPHSACSASPHALSVREIQPSPTALNDAMLFSGLDCRSRLYRTA